LFCLPSYFLFAETTLRMREYYHERPRIAPPRGGFYPQPLYFNFVLCHKHVDPSKSIAVKIRWRTHEITP
jgi:hypothetical protein